MFVLYNWLDSPCREASPYVGHQAKTTFVLKIYVCPIELILIKTSSK